ncbi:meiosis-specific coiled-coil domain-containing protein MEIOC-like [Protopterus annectens]|uniref:meiosis-specific coiled-coil domain-containing protein MEIOC-like n=1 Tax=Protopterus annectens TaxID=7888 RepID=UPI001CFB2B7A|nr:meiosis-specific coiled-coil domain-containing protein MEIOC-like [Protopterus annectens]
MSSDPKALCTSPSTEKKRGKERKIKRKRERERQRRSNLRKNNQKKDEEESTNLKKSFPDQAQINPAFSGNGPDMFGIVSSIMEEPNKTEPLSEWSSLSRMFPDVWSPIDGVTINSSEHDSSSMLDSSSFADQHSLQNCYQGNLQTSPENQVETLCQGFQDMNLVESWLSSVRENSDLSNQQSTEFKPMYVEKSLFRLNTPSQQESFSAQARQFDINRNFDCERTGNGHENMPYLNKCHFQNKNKGSIDMNKEHFKAERFTKNRYTKNSSRDQSRTVVDQTNHSVGDTWGRAFLQNHHSPKRYKDFSVVQEYSNTLSPSLSNFGQQFSKEDCFSGVPNQNPVLDVTCKDYVRNLRGNFDSSDKVHLSPVNSLPRSPEYIKPVLQNVDRHTFTGGQIWSDDDVLSPTVKHDAVHGNQKAACSPQASSSSGVSTMSSSGSPTQLRTSPVAQPTYYPQTPPLCKSRQEGRFEMLGDNSAFSSPTKQTHRVTTGHQITLSSTNEDQYCKPPLNFSNWTAHRNSGNDNSDKYHRFRNKHGQNSNTRDDRRGHKPWFLQQSHFGQTHSQQNSYRRKQDQDSGNLSDFINHAFIPHVPFGVSDFLQNPNLPHFNPHTFSSPPSFSFPSSTFPFSELIDLFHYEDFNQLNPFFNELFYRDMAAQYFCFPPPFNKFRPMRNRSGPANELHTRLEQCYEQWRALEKERKKTEADLARNFPGKRVSSSNNNPIPRLPANPSRVDRLIVDQLREQTRVLTLIRKMERLRGFPIHANISAAVDRHLEAVHITQARRKDEIINAANRQRQGAPRYSNEKDVLALAAAIKELSVSTRKARTALWCALQMTLPKTSFSYLAKPEDVEKALQELCPGTNGAQEETGTENKTQQKMEKNLLAKNKIEVQHESATEKWNEVMMSRGKGIAFEFYRNLPVN